MPSRRFPLILFIVFNLAVLMAAKSVSADVYELRTYTTNEDKLDNLHARFRDHTMRIFNRHGMKSVGYWVPTEKPKSQNTLIYVLKHTSPKSAEASWKAFRSDPEWQKVARESEVDGKILAKAPESLFMDAADYSPKYKSDKTDDEVVFELRIYRTNKGKLKNLDARFRDHTIGLFAKHGIRSVAYWHPVNEPDSTDTLIYIIRHDGRDAAKKSWQAFGSDPEWQKVARESQVDGRILRESPESIYMKATDYSAIK